MKNTPSNKKPKNTKLITLADLKKITGGSKATCATEQIVKARAQGGHVNEP